MTGHANNKYAFVTHSAIDKVDVYFSIRTKLLVSVSDDVFFAIFMFFNNICNKAPLPFFSCINCTDFAIHFAPP